MHNIKKTNKERQEHSPFHLFCPYDHDDVLLNDVPGGWEIKAEAGTDYAVMRSDEYCYSGTHSCRFESRYTDPPVATCPGRAELKTISHEPLGEYWYAWRFFIPGGQFLGSSVHACIGQWHAVPDFNEGESWRNPPLSVYLNQEQISLKVNATDKRVVEIGDYQVDELLWEETFIRNTWYSFVLNVGWDYRRRGNGFVKTWLTRGAGPCDSIVDYRGPVGYNDETGPYFKWGIYNFRWKKMRQEGAISNVSRLIVYYDDIRIGNNTCTFEDMT